jgi:hypothetical protein
VPGEASLEASGGGILVHLASPTVEDCIIESCSAARGGGAMLNRSSATLRRCIVRGNSASDSGGGLALVRSDHVLVEQCRIEGNSAPTGGGILASLGTAEIRDCEIMANSSTGPGSALRWTYPAPDPGLASLLTVDGCTIRENSSAEFGAALSATPDPATLALRDTEICDNLTRNVSGPFIDLGGNLLCDCPADLNGDGEVAAQDITFVIGWWGPCGSLCPADIDRNGAVDAADLSIVMGAWGECP